MTETQRPLLVTPWPTTLAIGTKGVASLPGHLASYVVPLGELGEEMGHLGWENGLEQRQRRGLDSSASWAWSGFAHTPPLLPVHGDHSSKQQTILLPEVTAPGTGSMRPPSVLLIRTSMCAMF